MDRSKTVSRPRTTRIGLWGSSPWGSVPGTQGQVMPPQFNCFEVNSTASCQNALKSRLEGAGSLCAQFFPLAALPMDFCAVAAMDRSPWPSSLLSNQRKSPIFLQCSSPVVSHRDGFTSTGFVRSSWDACSRVLPVLPSVMLTRPKSITTSARVRCMFP